MATSKKTSRPRRRKDRAATEQALIDACGRLLLRDGADGIGLNNVVAEAGVGKDLIYRYFGGLPGLIQAWTERGQNWPDAEEIIGSNPEAFKNRPLNEQIKTIEHNYIRALRERPVVMRIMASELMHPTSVTEVLEKQSERLGTAVADLITGLPQSRRDDVTIITMVFYCMLNYLCMRAVTSPQCFGMDLKEEESWERITHAIDTLTDRFLAPETEKNT